MKLKNDKYRKARGGYSRLLEINCSSCGSNLCLYQKDGPGIIKRMYVDRIISNSKMFKGDNFKCTQCGNLIGYLTIYEKEKRPAYSIVHGSISKKVLKQKSIH